MTAFYINYFILQKFKSYKYLVKFLIIWFFNFDTKNNTKIKQEINHKLMFLFIRYDEITKIDVYNP